nr:hypothetical protein [Tanacetum cinerariifolium]
GQRKTEGQWIVDESKAANLDQRLKSLSMSVLPDDQINSVINCLTTKSTWDDLILYHEGPYDVKESKVMDLKLCYNTFKFKKAKSKRFFKKGTQRFSSAKATDQTERHKCGKKGHFARDCWSKTLVPSYQSPFQPNLLHSSEHKPEPRLTKDFKAKYNKVKAKLALLSSSASVPSSSSSKNKVTDYDSANESSVCNTPLPPLEKLIGVEPVSGPKTIKSILKSKSSFKAGTLKGITINEPSLTLVRGNKSSSASKTNSAPAVKLKNVKIEDDPPLAIIMKELNELKLQFRKNKSSYFKNKNSQ